MQVLPKPPEPPRPPETSEPPELLPDEPGDIMTNIHTKETQLNNLNSTQEIPFKEDHLKEPEKEKEAKIMKVQQVPEMYKDRDRRTES